MSLFQKTLGGLSPTYFFRQLFFGSALLAALLWLLLRHQPVASVPPPQWVYFAVCWLLYPYAQFCYETAMGFLLGQNRFLVHGCLFVGWKLFVMFWAFCLAPLIAPVGLVMLYFINSRRARDVEFS